MRSRRPPAGWPARATFSHRRRCRRNVGMLIGRLRRSRRFHRERQRRTTRWPRWCGSQRRPEPRPQTTLASDSPLHLRMAKKQRGPRRLAEVTAFARSARHLHVSSVHLHVASPRSTSFRVVPSEAPQNSDPPPPPAAHRRQRNDAACFAASTPPRRPKPKSPPQHPPPLITKPPRPRICHCSTLVTLAQV